MSNPHSAQFTHLTGDHHRHVTQTQRRLQPISWTVTPWRVARGTAAVGVLTLPLGVDGEPVSTAGGVGLGPVPSQELSLLPGPMCRVTQVGA